MSAPERVNAGIGIAYGLLHLDLVIYMIDYRASSSQARYFRERQDKIKNVVKDFGVLQRFYEGIQLRGIALSLIKEVDDIVENFRSWSWEAVYRAQNKVYDHMEEELRRLGMIPPEQQAEGSAKWEWDPHRRQYYYWAGADNMYKYQNGLWVRPDGTETNAAQEAALKRAAEEAARRGPPAPPALPGYANGVTDGMRQLTMGKGEDHNDYEEQVD